MENLLIPENKSNYGPKSPWTYTQKPYPILSSVEFFFANTSITLINCFVAQSIDFIT